MRIYELAKELGVANKDLLTKLKDGGFQVTTHMAVVTPEIQAFVEGTLKKQAATPAPQPSRTHSQPQKNAIPVETKTPSNFSAKQQEAPIVQQQKKQPAPVQTPVRSNQSLHDEAVDFVAPTKIIVAEEPKKLDIPDFEQVEAQEMREQERIKRLLTTAHFATPGLQMQQGPRRRRRRKYKPQHQQREPEKKAVTAVTVTGNMALFEVAELFGKQSSDLVLALLKKGQVCNRNHILLPDVIKSLGQQFNIAVTIPNASDKSSSVVARKASDKGQARWPVVVIMGHVDHGKTSLLDYIKKMNVAASEKGGITQHIRAWEAATAQGGKVVFLDTPGHEAFSYMRQRGSSITDIAILVVAADDGIMPQTVEAINHAKAAGVPIIVAINKIDKVSSPSAIETIKRQLAQHELMPSEWGGQTEIVQVSAKTGQGIDALLELIVLQAELMELKAERNVTPKAFVLESHVERGFGPVATVIVQEGTLKVGDFFICGGSTGKVRILVDSHEQRIKEAVPSTPVQVVGFDSFNNIGDELKVVPQQEYSRARSQKSAEIQAPTAAPQLSAAELLGQNAKAKDKKSINLVIKTDTRGSKEAVMDCIDKVIKANKEIKCPVNIVTTGIGDITEGDIELAENTDAIILGLHVKIEKNAQSMAKDKGVNVQVNGIIYELVDYLSALIKSKKEAVFSWNKVGEATVKKVFDIKGIGIIAGCYMREGVLSRGNKVVCMRGNKQMGEAKVTSLQRDRKTVKEIHAGYECGFTADGFNEWQEGDSVICYAETRVE